MHELQRERNRIVDPLMREYPVAYPLVVGRLQAGDWASSVPDRLVAEGRLGVRIDEDLESARDELEELAPGGPRADPFLRDHPPVRDLVGRPVRRRPPAGRASAARRRRAGARGRHGRTERRGNAARPTAATSGSTPGSGIPTLHYGPGDVRLAHGPEEAVEIDEVLRVVEALVLTTLRVAGDGS